MSKKTMKAKTGWMRVAYRYDRDSGDSGATQTVISNITTDFTSVKKAVLEYVASWTGGPGEIEIYWVETGPFVENFLTDKQEAYFEGRVYKF